MKFLIPALLVPVLAFAQAPQGQFDEQQMFEQIKKMMLPVMNKSLPVMQKIKSCIEQSQSSQDLDKCVDIMMTFQQEMAATMGEGNPGQSAVPERPQLEWSRELKAEMLNDIGKSIQDTTATKACLESSASGTEMDACMTKAGLGQR